MFILSGLMAITLWGIALPIIVLAILGTWLLGLASYRDDLLAWKTFIGILCFGSVYWLTGLDWTPIFSWWSLAYIGGWIVAGGVWFLFKWNKFVGRARANADKELSRVQSSNGRFTDPQEIRAFMLRYRPELDSNKERAIGWIILWPFSVLAYIFGDLLHDLADWVIERLRSTARRITAYHFGEFEAPAPQTE